MKIFLASLVLCPFISFTQNKDSAAAIQNFHSPVNVKKFADFLFCSGDYLRSIDEYKKYLQDFEDDTAEFKIGLGLSGMKKYKEAADHFALGAGKNSSLSYQIEFQKALLQSGNYALLRKSFFRNPESNEIKRLNYLSYFYTDDPLPDEKEFLAPFFGESRTEIKNFYGWKSNPPYKQEWKAVILSALIPGAGKFYLKEYGDGIAAFAAAVLSGYLSYDNFKAGHKFRGWLFAGISGFFYAGNIYGSAAGVPIFNAKLYLDFCNKLDLYLDRKNYFLPEYNFCK